MGLLTKEVKIKLHPSNISYFESLGYEIPRHYDERDKCYKVKRGTEITVRISDVKPNSMCEVEIECDCCHEILKRTYQSYNRYKKENGIYYCSSCYSKLFKSGENHPNWNPNLTDEERTIKRNYNDYDIFRKKVLSRDYYKCQCCGHESTDLEVHHLDAYNWCIEKRTDIDNGVTLCNYCHIIFHKKYGKGEVTKEQYDNWINNINFDELLKDKNEIIQSNKKHGQIYCVTTGEIFYSFREAAGVYDIKQMDNIRLCCLGKSKSCGKNKNGEKLIWMYYKDYINLNNSFTVA